MIMPAGTSGMSHTAKCIIDLAGTSEGMLGCMADETPFRYTRISKNWGHSEGEYHSGRLGEVSGESRYYICPLNKWLSFVT